MITICLHGDKLTTADLGWFRGAVDAASGHSGSDYPIEITDGMISVEIPGEEEEDAEADDSPLKVGDRVRVLESDPCLRSLDILTGKTGILIRLNSSKSLPFAVRFDQDYAGDDEWNVKSVERVKG